MNFAEAFSHIRSGSRVAMKEWSPGTYLIQRIYEHGGKQSFPVVIMHQDYGISSITWSPTQRELYDDTWEIIPPPLTQTVSPAGATFFKAAQDK